MVVACPTLHRVLVERTCILSSGDVASSQVVSRSCSEKYTWALHQRHMCGVSDVHACCTRPTCVLYQMLVGVVSEIHLSDEHVCCIMCVCALYQRHMCVVSDVHVCCTRCSFVILDIHMLHQMHMQVIPNVHVCCIRFVCVLHQTYMCVVSDMYVHCIKCSCV